MIWANVDPVLCRHVVSLGRNELMKAMTYLRMYNSIVQTGIKELTEPLTELNPYPNVWFLQKLVGLFGHQTV